VELPPTDWEAIHCVGTTKRWHTCDLTDLQWGVPAILVSFGRSGSSVSWDLLTALASPEDSGQLNVERTGSGQTGALDRLHEFPHEHGKCWLERIMCTLQTKITVRPDRARVSRPSMAPNGRRPCESLLIGKSSVASKNEFLPFIKVALFPLDRKSSEALEWLAVNPHIKVIHNTRNLLDVAISRRKHQTHGHLPSHCQDETCAEKQKVHTMVMPVDELLGSLTTLKHGRDFVTRQLDSAGVPRIDVTYERLYYAPTAEEWMRIVMFRFAGVGPTNNLTMTTVHQRMHLFVTHPPTRNETLRNYNEIVMGLRGTEWEQLLKPVWEEALP
jgi:hypothetical protein